ncbi:MAG: TolB family protein, partial [Gemmatimonadota bacterium]
MKGSASTSAWIGMVGLAALLLTAAPAVTQAPPPDGDWMTFRTEHFRVTYPPELEPLARHAAAVAESAHRVLARELADPPTGVIDLVLTDHADYSNGFARLFPSQRIVVFARPGTTEPEFFAADWVELVVAHELVHAFHLERTGAAGRVIRSVLGRVPSIWPVFPAAGTPTWSVEGLATHYETRLTGGGRIRSSIHEMIVRTAALDGRIPALDALSAPNPVWPAGNRSYIYGARLMRFIADRYGDDALREIVEATAGSVWPTFLRFDHVAQTATGRPFDVLYDEWRTAATDSADAAARRVRAAGLTPTRPVAGRGPFAIAPRVAPDGKRLAWSASDWRSDPTTRILDLGTGRVRTLAERNQFGAILDPPAWLPDGSGFVVAQLELHGRYRAYSDLWSLDTTGVETRLTEGLRLAQPDVAADGRIAAVQYHRGGTRLVTLEPDGTVRVVADAAPGQAYDRPRWGPAGRIAVGRHTGGRMDLMVVDPAAGTTVQVTDDDALDMAPAWSPDGRWLLWWSDRTGIPNIMAVAVVDGRPTGPVRQVTNVLTGVIDPEVDPSGETVYVAAYHHDGWRIEALPFDPDRWPVAPPSRMEYDEPVLSRTLERDAGGPASPYSPLPTVRPYYWLPTFESLSTATDPLRFVGVQLGGRDVVERHVWSVGMAADPGTGRVQGWGSWVYRGLGSPELFVSAARDWGGAGTATDDGFVEPILVSDHDVAVGAVFHRSRWRSSAALRLTLEMERQALEGRDLSRGQLAARGFELPEPVTLAGVAASPGYQNVRVHPFSISPEDGISARARVGRWWETGAGAHAYDELGGTIRGYLGVPLWGFANHVLTVRAEGLRRTGA